MAFIVRYIKQSDIDNMGKWSGKIPTAEEIEARKSQVKVAMGTAPGKARGTLAPGLWCRL